MISENKLKCIKSFEEGLFLYKSKKFKEAMDKFYNSLLYDQDDGPSKLYIERCQFFISNPVNDDWDGVFDMKTK